MAIYQQGNSTQGGTVNTTEQRNLGALTYKIGCKWEDEDKEGELRLGAEGEPDCM